MRIAPMLVQFTDESTGPIASWHWDFGDGSISTQSSPQHTYQAGGNYTVTLTIYDNKGNSKQRSMSIIVLTLVAAFNESPSSGNSPLLVTFTDLSVASSTSTIISWNWDFGDGNTSTLQNPTHTYTSTGTFSIMLTITDAIGNTANTSNSISVNQSIPAYCGSSPNDITQMVWTSTTIKHSDTTINGNIVTFQSNASIGAGDETGLSISGPYCNTSTNKRLIATITFSHNALPSADDSLIIELFNASNNQQDIYEVDGPSSTELNKTIVLSVPLNNSSLNSIQPSGFISRSGLAPGNVDFNFHGTITLSVGT